MPMFTKLISGGQTGVDRAALDLALERGIPCGGWCPKGRRAEDGPLPDRYPLVETTWWGYPQRTAWNIRDSDGTLVLLSRQPDRGTQLTIKLAERLKKPCLVVDLTAKPDVVTVRDWARTHQVRILNVAGPRASQCRGIYQRAKRFLAKLLDS